MFVLSDVIMVCSTSLMAPPGRWVTGMCTYLYFTLVDTLLPWVCFPSPFSPPAAIMSTQPFSVGFTRIKSNNELYVTLGVTGLGYIILLIRKFPCPLSPLSPSRSPASDAWNQTDTQLTTKIKHRTDGKSATTHKKKGKLFDHHHFFFLC